MVSSLVSFVLIWGSIVSALSLTVLAWRQRPKPGATAFAVLMAGGTWWVATSSIGLFTTEMARRLFLHKLEWVGLVTIPVAWLLFALEYTRRSEFVSKRTVALLGLVPGITLGLVWTNDIHGLIYATRTVNVYGGISIVKQTYGIWFWVYIAFAYTLLGTGTVMILQLIVTARSLYRGQVVALLITVVAPWTGNLIFVAGYSPVPNLDITPFMFLISGAAGLAALTQFKLLDSVPVSNRIAYKSVVEGMNDGVVVVDSDDYIVDINPRASELLEIDAKATIETPVTDLLPIYDDLKEADASDARETIELDRSDGMRYYEVRVTVLGDDRRGSVGTIIVLYDVTDQRSRIQQLDVLNRVLRHNLRNEMNVVYGYADKLDDDDATEYIQQKATKMVDLGNKAREIDRILNDETESEPLPVQRLVDIEIERTRENNPGVELDCSVPDEEISVPPTLGPVLRNLVENAIEHNTSDQPHVRIAVSDEHDTLVVEVTDNGPGIPEQEQAILRSQEETQLKHSSGLGLWLVNWGVQRMGGSIAVKYPENGGTTVRVELPSTEQAMEVKSE